MAPVARPISNCKLRTRPLVRERAPHQQTRNCLKITLNKKLSRVPDWCLTPRQAGRLTVGRNATLTFKWTKIRPRPSFSHRLRSPGTHLTLNGRNIPFLCHVKHLGVIFDKEIAWRLHIEMTEAKNFRTFIRIYSPFKSDLLSSSIK
jgi:hypothetical protein